MLGEELLCRSQSSQTLRQAILGGVRACTPCGRRRLGLGLSLGLSLGLGLGRGDPVTLSLNRGQRRLEGR